MATLTEVDIDPFNASPLDSALSAEGIKGHKADFIRSIYKQESSSGKNTKTSNSGAVGGMQITPATFSTVADKEWDIKDPIQNARAGARYAAQMYDKANGDVKVAAAGYYGGSGGLSKAAKGVPVSDPRNPNAPNTLQYGDQVSKHMPTVSEVDYDPFAEKTKAAPAAPTPTEKPRTWYDEIGRQVGLTARGAVGGVASTLDIPAAVVNPIINRVAGTNLSSSPTRDLSERVMTAAGLPQPQNGLERVVQAGVGAMTGAGGSAGLATQLARTASTPLAKSVLGMLGSSPGAQIASSATGGMSGQTVAEAGGGPVAQTVASLVGGTIPLTPTIARNVVRGAAAAPGTRQAQVQSNAAEAHDAGYVLPPAQVSGSVVSDTLGGWSGKKIEQKASLKNQENTNNLVKEEFKLPNNAVLDEKTFSDIRKEAGKAYKAVQSVTDPIKTDTSFRNDISQIGGANSQAAKEFPELMANPEIAKLRNSLYNQKPFTTKGAIELVKQLRGDATQNLKALGDPSRHALGLAQREAANAMDDLVERNLERLGKPDLVNEYRTARQTIAKAHDMESVTNTVTGNVSARGAARLMDKGKPLTGNLEKVAKFGAAFPQSAKNVDMLGSVTDSSALDFGLALATAAHGRPDVAGAILARPLARNMLLSKPYQKAVFTPRETLPLGGLAQTFKPGPSPVPLSQLMNSTQEQ